MIKKDTITEAASYIRRDVIKTSIRGITTEIDRRNECLRQRKAVLLGHLNNGTTTFNMHGLYVDGYRIMKEAQKLVKIRHDLEVINNCIVC